MIEKTQLRNLVKKVITDMDYYSPEAEELILGTIAQESAGGKYLKQLGSGVAQGICQMEKATHDDIVENFLEYKRIIREDIIKASGVPYLDFKFLESNLAYSIAMCRAHYLRFPEAIPKTLEGQAAVWKRCYNTYLGAGTEEEYIRNYKKYVL